MFKKIKIFFIFFFITTNLQSYSYSDDINQIELDGLSLGESLLNFISKEEIKKNIIQYFEDERDYYVVFYDKDLSQYNDFEIYLKTDDNNYEIKGLNGGIYPKNLKECLTKLDEISSEISSALDIIFIDDSSNHGYYKNSFINGRTVELEGGYLRIDCMFYDEKDKLKHPSLVDNLAVMLKSYEIERWFESGYK